MKNITDNLFLRKHTFFHLYITTVVIFLVFLSADFIVWEYSIDVYGVGAAAIILTLFVVFISVAVTFSLYSTVRSLQKAFISAEKAINLVKENKERYALAVSSAAEGLWDWDVKKDSLYVSPYWKKMFGYGGVDDINTMASWKERVHKDDVVNFENALKRHRSGATAHYDVEYRMRTKSGIYIWVRNRGMATRGIDGDAIRITGSTNDISNVKRVEEVLRRRTDELERAHKNLSKEMQNSRKFQQAVQSATDAITIMTKDGAMLYANPAWEAFSGYKFGEVKERPFDFLYSAKTDKGILRDMHYAMRKGQSFVSEEIITERDDGSDYETSLSLFPISERGNVVFYTAVQQDITKRKEIDRAKTEFVSLASHQLRTPLSAIRWYSEMILSGGAGDINDTQKKYIKEIYDANKRMIELVSSLLNVSRIDLGTFAISPVMSDLESIADSVIHELAYEIENKKLTIRKKYERDIPNVNVDTKLMRMVFQNLITNAVKYTPGGGAVEVKIHREGENILFSIRDDGIGIPQEQQKDIFTKLFRADNAREVDTGGTGLGLYISKAIMEKSGGSMSFESKEGEGTVFHCSIPLNGSLYRGGTKMLT